MVNDEREGETEGHPDGGPAEGFLEADNVGLAVEDAQVQSQHGEHEGNKDQPGPDCDGALERSQQSG